MKVLSNLSLQQSVSLLVLVGLAVGLGLFSGLGIQSLNDSTRRVLQERLTVARTMASHLDETLNHVLVQVGERTRHAGGMPTPEEFRQSAGSLTAELRQFGITVPGVYLMDDKGAILQVEPEDPRVVGMPLAEYAYLTERLQAGRPVMSNLVDSPATLKPVVFAAAPILGEAGETLGAIAAAIDINTSAIGGFVEPVSLGETGYTELIDKNGWVLARTQPGRPAEALEVSDHPGRFATLLAERTATVRTCHRCHGPVDQPERRRDVLAFAPLETTTWGVAVRQSEEEAFALTAQLKKRLLISGGIVVVGLFLLVWVMIQGIVRPIRSLTAAASRVAAGDFDAVRPLRRRDEIGQLSETLAAMTRDLAGTHRQLVSRNQELLALNSVATTVSQSLELKDVLDRALLKVLEVTGDQTGCVFIPDPNRALKMASWAGSATLFACPEASRSEAECACHQTMLRDRPQVVNDISQCPMLARRHAQSEESICFASVPLLSKERAVGVMNVACVDGACFTEDDFRLLDSIGRQVGLAVENSLLYQGVKNEEEVRGQLLNAVINAEEEERKRLSRELHDGAGQTLTGLIMSIESAESVVASEDTLVSQRLGRARMIAVHLLEDMRKMMQDLRSTVLDDLGLVAAIRHYAETHLEPAGVAVDFHAEGFDRRLPPSPETALFRIAQEAIHNIIKHAHARNARIWLATEDGRARLVIEDDGRGFDVDGFSASNGRGRSLGLMGMSERATMIGGNLFVTSTVGHGTRVAVEVPLDAAATR